MKFFLFVSVTTAIMLSICVQLGMQKTTTTSGTYPVYLQHYFAHIKETFKSPENANVLFGLITGVKKGISPFTFNAFKLINLSFLFSLSGIHIASLLIILNFLIKKIRLSWLRHLSKLLVFSAVLFIPGHEAIKRLMILRIIFQLKFITKLKISYELIFILTFLCSFIAGHFNSSPLSFIFSFAFLGTFFSLRNYSILKLILGLFSTQLILGLFMGSKVSLLSIPCGLIFSLIFSVLFPILLIFIASFWIFHFNWIEPIIKIYLISIKFVAKGLMGSFTSSSIFLILGIWVLMSSNDFKKKYILLALFLFLHTNTAMTPAIFH